MLRNNVNRPELASGGHLRKTSVSSTWDTPVFTGVKTIFLGQRCQLPRSGNITLTVGQHSPHLLPHRN